MGLLAGPVSVTRYTVSRLPEELDFDAAAFRELPPGSEVRQRAGFVPFEPEAPYRVGQHRFAFRVRVDTVRPDPTAVQERLKQLEKTERESTGKPFVPAKVRRKLRQLAEEELLVRASPRSRMVECVLEDTVLYVGTTSASLLSTVLELLRGLGLDPELRTPWYERGEQDVDSEVVEPRGPGQAVLGCRFLKALSGDGELLIEPESGAVTLQTAEARVALRGAVLPDLQRYLKGDAELLSARLVHDNARFRLDALSFRVASLRVECERHDSWIEQLDARLEQIVAVHEALDAAYARLSAGLHAL